MPIIRKKAKANFINRICIFIIMGIRPFLGPAYCIHLPSCTIYAYQQLEEHALWYALFCYY